MSAAAAATAGLMKLMYLELVAPLILIERKKHARTPLRRAVARAFLIGAIFYRASLSRRTVKSGIQY